MRNEQTQRTSAFLFMAFALHAVILTGSLLVFKSPPLLVTLRSKNFSTHVVLSSSEKKEPPQKAVPQKPKPLPQPSALRTKPTPPIAPQEAVKPVDEIDSGSQTVVRQEEIDRYINRLVRRIDARKRYPRISREKGEEGLVRVRLIIGRSGELVDYSLLPSSSPKRLIQATIDTIVASGPFPPLPEGYSQNSLSVEVPVRYKYKF